MCEKRGYAQQTNHKAIKIRFFCKLDLNSLELTTCYENFYRLKSQYKLTKSKRTSHLTLARVINLCEKYENMKTDYYSCES